ncbi:hypothetical protein V2J09_019923 [Rumex salicifolius]
MNFNFELYFPTELIYAYHSTHLDRDTSVEKSASGIWVKHSKPSSVFINNLYDVEIPTISASGFYWVVLSVFDSSIPIKQGKTEMGDLVNFGWVYR